MSLQLRYAARSDVGKVRSKNDDSAYVGRFLAVVADGMGGHVGGDVASASTVLDLAPLDHPEHSDPANILADEIQSANLILNDLVHANPKLAGMGTTCTALLLDEDTLHFAHIGDSRAYRLKDDTFEQVSKDHTFVQRLIDEGRLEPEQAETHPHKNVLMRVLGDVDASPELDVDHFEAEIGERWLLCSDGLMAVVPDHIIEEKMRSTDDIQQIVDDLTEITLAGGSPDNVTIVVFELEKRNHDEDAETELDELTHSAAEVAASDPEARISAALLRHELSSRPHLLVGAAQLATDTDQIPIVTRSSSQKRANTLLHGSGQANSTTQTSDERVVTHDTDTDERPKGRNWPLLTAFGVVLALVIGGLTLSVLWVRNQYYVGISDDTVAVYRGVSQNIGPFSLSSVEEESDIPVSRLPGYTRSRVESGLPAQDMNHANDILNDLRTSLTPEAPPVVESSTGSDPIPVVPTTDAQGSIGGVSAGITGGTP